MIPAMEEKSIDNVSTELDMSSQGLDILPSEITENTRLTHVYLDYNDLTYLPSDFGTTLNNLMVLSAIGNSLCSLPDSFGSLLELKELHLNENDLKELPVSICKLCSLQKICLTGNSIELLPESFGELGMLRQLSIDENCLSKLPKTLGLLENLTHLDLGCNCIRELPVGIGNMKSLEVLNLSSNKIEVLPETFGNLAMLKAVDISCNQIKLLPSHFASSQTIEKFYADVNLLQCLPTWTSKMLNITELSLKDNQFQHQTLPNSFPLNAKNLRILNMAGNFMENLPDSLGMLQNLEYLHLGSVIGELERRHFQNGNWLACVPDSVCCLGNLKELHVDENQISELPSDFGQLGCLEILDLGQNLLHELPESFGKLSSLKICLLSKNHLQLLPSNFGNLCSLEDLRLDNNEVAELPESFAKLSSLKTLDLFNNRLTEIPSALHDLRNLIRLDIEENDFKVPLTEVPQIVTQSKYPPRDPNLKDNWRGRPRQDLSGVEDSIIKVESEDCPDFEPPLPDLNYSEDFLIRAMKQSLSIWRGHSDKSSKRKSRKRYPNHYVMDSDSEEEHGNTDEEEEEEEVDEDDEFEPPIFTGNSRISADKENQCKTEEVDCVKAMLEEDCEDWDKEIEEIQSNMPYDPPPVYTHPVFRNYSPVENGQFTFAPYDIHCQDYVKRLEVYEIEENQFDDSERDETDELNIDPVF